LVYVDDINDARSIISEEMSVVNSGIQDIFDSNDYNMNYVVRFGDNYFPDKEYKGIQYKAGEYESLVVVIGEGNGDNWWCVLFPPLCLLEGEDNDVNDVEYAFFVQKFLDKVFK
jgi:stage II sporulation protein R